MWVYSLSWRISGICFCEGTETHAPKHFHVIWEPAGSRWALSARAWLCFRHGGPAAGPLRDRKSVRVSLWIHSQGAHRFFCDALQGVHVAGGSSRFHQNWLEKQALDCHCRRWGFFTADFSSLCNPMCLGNGNFSSGVPSCSSAGASGVVTRRNNWCEKRVYFKELLGSLCWLRVLRSSMFFKTKWRTESGLSWGIASIRAVVTHLFIILPCRGQSCCCYLSHPSFLFSLKVSIGDSLHCYRADGALHRHEGGCSAPPQWYWPREDKALGE